ncbi:hypothetical protein [Tenacibaculum agarivorans]|uniref:hypothetical protein n=1 Tax=Tenacibaculum agarivorans TaxID=1908389 RepID=UPI000AAB0FD8|nr:hypothetical protein [Tenacibaculum agarivorans]
MKNRIPLYLGLANLCIVVIVFTLLYFWSSLGNSIILINIVLFIFLGIVLSIFGVILTIQYKLRLSSSFWTSLILNSLFPIVLLILMLPNIKDIIMLFK